MSLDLEPVDFANAGQSWDDVMETATRFRHYLHRHPELSWQETETAAAIRAALGQLGIAWRACAGTGTVATIASGRPGRHIALRGDIDALPILERSGQSWASTREGVMHACGHDGHTATLMAAAIWLKRHEDALPGPVSLLFQPAEEGGHGAREMIADGALEGVDAVFGWHNWPAIPYGKAVCPEGPVMAGNGTFQITVKGVGGHASQPEACRDPVLAASAIVLALQQVVSRRIRPQHPAVLSVTSIEAPSLNTVIPETAAIGGSIRIAIPEDRAVINGLIEEIACDTAKAYGVEAAVEVAPRYEATVNHASQSEEMRGALADELGPDWHDAALPVPIMASEDFSYFLGKVPGAFALIGADDGENHDAPCHSPLYDFNDRLIPIVARCFARLAGAPLPNTGTGQYKEQSARAALQE